MNNASAVLAAPSISSTCLDLVLVDPIVPIEPIAPVAKHPPVEQTSVDSFCAAILSGHPTAKILPAPISELKTDGALSADQLNQIKAARKAHDSGAEEQRKELFALARSRRLRGFKFNRDSKLIGLRFGDFKTVKVKRTKTK